MTVSIVRLASVALCATVLWMQPAAAQTKAAPARISPAGATSACLGQASTPVCAAETLLACLARGDAGLCRTVMPAMSVPQPNGLPQVEYVVERVSVIRGSDVTEDLKDLDWYKPGYTLVEIMRRACPASESDCGAESWDGVQVYLRRGADSRWEIVHWRSDAEPDTPPEDPENFQTATIPAR